MSILLTNHYKHRILLDMSQASANYYRLRAIGTAEN